MFRRTTSLAAMPRYVLAVAIAATFAGASHASTPEREPSMRVAAAPLGGGGPDAFGYTWAVSGDIGGPVFDWIDISTTGTLVTGLADDNSAAAIPLPFPFRYYWTDIQQIKIGSNGWIGFDNGVSNIASCFPGIPTAGGAGDTYVAPFMSDLNFTGTGNPGQVRYLIDAPNQRVIVSFINVPYWSLNAPGFTGSNTFQVILDAVTRSIKFQYQGLTNFIANAGCVDIVGGIESPQGTIGLQLFNDAQPPGNRAVEFTYPDPPLISVIDPTPTALLNADSGGSFVYAGAPMTLTASVTNTGDGATTSAVSAQARMIDSVGATAYDQTLSVPSLAGGASEALTYVPDFVPAEGHYSFRIDVSGGGDINAGNNIRVGEVVAIPAGPAVLDYIGAQAPDGTVNWNNVANTTDDDGSAVLIVPPGPGYVVRSMSTFIVSNGGGVPYKLKLIDNDGPDGLPGTVLGEVLVPAAAITLNTWQTSTIANTAVDDDGFYVVWIDRGNINIATSTTPPISRRSLELLSGGYATWRNNDFDELFLRAAIAPDAVFANGFED
jgi:hypothetical protein